MGRLADNDAYLRGRFRGAMLGAAIGDALGAPFEGTGSVRREELDRLVEQPGRMQWTDDAHMTIGMAESLTACQGFDGEHMARHFAERYEHEPWRGYGPGPPQVFAALERGAHWDEAGRELFDGSGSFGNGAAMRVAPAALFAHPDLHEAATLARKTSMITHAHEWGIDGAVIQGVALTWVLQQPPGKPLDRTALCRALSGHVRSEACRQALRNVTALSPAAAPADVVVRLGNGIEALRSAPTALFAFLRSPEDFAEVVLFIISLGGDTDTMASMAGALAGAYVGEKGIPARWRMEVEQGEYLVALADGLFELRRRAQPPH